MKFIPALRKNDDLIKEIDSFNQDKDRFHLWWLGQSGFLLQWNGKRVLLDPYLSDSLTKKYAGTDKPHIRMSEMVLNPAMLRNIMIVSSSHNHTDHLDADTLIPILQNNPGAKFIIPEANRSFVCERVKCDLDFPLGLTANGSITIDDFTIHGVPAKHNEIEKDEMGNCKFMGYIISFGRYNIYHSGDTLWYDEMVGLLKPFDVDVAILPINGNDPARKVAGNLNCKEAAKLGRMIQAKNVIPCHYDMFTFNTASVDEFADAAKEINQPFTILRGGERFTGK